MLDREFGCPLIRIACRVTSTGLRLRPDEYDHDDEPDLTIVPRAPGAATAPPLTCNN
jgi:hypothetical protein